MHDFVNLHQSRGVELHSYNLTYNFCSHSVRSRWLNLLRRGETEKYENVVNFSILSSFNYISDDIVSTWMVSKSSFRRTMRRAWRFYNWPRTRWKKLETSQTWGTTFPQSMVRSDWRYITGRRAGGWWRCAKGSSIRCRRLLGARITTGFIGLIPEKAFFTMLMIYSVDIEWSRKLHHWTFS